MKVDFFCLFFECAADAVAFPPTVPTPGRGKILRPTSSRGKKGRPSVPERAASLKRCKCRTGYERRGGEEVRREEGARGPEMAALNPARSKTGFARHTKAPPRDEGSGEKNERERKRETVRKRGKTLPPRFFLLPLLSRR